MGRKSKRKRSRNKATKSTSEKNKPDETSTSEQKQQNELQLNQEAASSSSTQHHASTYSAEAQQTRGPERQINQKFGTVEAKSFSGSVGHLINNKGNLNFYQSTSSSKSETPREELEGKFLKLYEESTERETRDKVTATFDHLTTPEKQVNPRFKVVDFLKGHTAPSSDQYIPDSYYQTSTTRNYYGPTIQITQFLDKTNHAALIAGAGEGKTTTAKRFARMVLEKQIPSLTHIKLVHFVRIASLDSKKEYTVFDLLFNQTMGPGLTKELREFGHDWVQENLGDILLVLDGLDQAVWKPDEVESIPKIAYNREASASIIIHNIMNEGLLGNCKVVLTSREHALRHCHFDKDSTVTIALAGLTEYDSLYLIRSLAGSEAQAIENHLKLRSPGILSLCQSPMYLVFTVAVYLVDPKNPPQTLSGILIRVLAFFLKSENRRERNVTQIISKLKKLAYDGTMARKVLFTKQEIEDAGLTIDSVRDLLLVTPQKSKVTHFHIMEEGSFFVLFFCHQSIQEALCALYIAELSTKEFRTFVFEKLSDPELEVVKKILLGILFNPDIGSDDDKLVVGNIKKPSEKIGSLRKWLQRNFNSKDVEIDHKLCSLLFECGKPLDEILPKSLHTIACSNDLEDDELYMVTEVLRRSKHISKIMIDSLTPNMRTAPLLADALENKLAVIEDLTYLREEHISYHENMAKVFWNSFVKNLTTENCLEGISQCFQTALDMGCEIHLVEFIVQVRQNTSYCISRDSDADDKIAPTNGLIVELSNTCDNMQPQDFLHLGKILSSSNIGILNMSGCEVTEAKMKNLYESVCDVGGVQVGTLTFRKKCEMDAKAYWYLGKILTCSYVNEVDISECRLTIAKLCELEKSLSQVDEKMELEAFNIFKNQSLPPEGYYHLGRIMHLMHLHSLIIGVCELTFFKLQKFEESLKTDSRNMKVSFLDLSFNCSLSTLEDYSVMGRIVNLLKVDMLEISGCMVTYEKLNQLDKSLSDRQEKLSVRTNDFLELPPISPVVCYRFSRPKQELNFKNLKTVFVQYSVLESQGLSLHYWIRKTNSYAKFEVDTLDFSSNKPLEYWSYYYVGVMHDCLNPRKLDLRNCDLTAYKIRDLNSQVRKRGARLCRGKTKVLDISSYEKESDLDVAEMSKFMAELGFFIRVHMTEHVHIVGYKIWPESAHELIRNMGGMLRKTKFVTQNGEYSAEEINRLGVKNGFWSSNQSYCPLTAMQKP